jgi:hypothetical protein
MTTRRMLPSVACAHTTRPASAPGRRYRSGVGPDQGDRVRHSRPVPLNTLLARFGRGAQAARPNRPASRDVGARTDRSTFRLSTAIIRACMGQATRIQNHGVTNLSTQRGR